MPDKGAKIQHQLKILKSRFTIATTASKSPRHQSPYNPKHHPLPKWRCDAEVFTITYTTATGNSYFVVCYLGNKDFSTGISY